MATSSRARSWFSSLFYINRLFVLRDQAAPNQRGLSARLRLEVLEDRITPTTNLYLDFGDNFTGARGLTVDGTAVVTHDNFVSTVNGPNLSIGAAGSTPYTFTSFSSLATTAGFTAAQITTLEADILSTVQRYYEPFDVNVVQLVGAAGSQTLNQIAAKETGGAAYDLIAGIVPDAGAINATLNGQAGGNDLSAQTNATSDLAAILANNLFTDGSASTALGVGPSALAFAYTAAHEAGHTFGLRHTNNEGAAGATQSGANDLLLTSSDIISKFYNSAGFLGAGRDQRFNFNFFTRFTLDEPPSEGWPAPGTENPFNILATNLGLAPGAPSYITGTGANDHITVTNTGGGTASVQVQAYSDTAMTTLITSQSYSVSTANGLLIETGAGTNLVEIDASLGVAVTIDGISGVDQLQIDGTAAMNAAYTPGATTSTSLDGRPNFTGSITAGTTTINFDEFNTTTSNILLKTFGVITVNGADGGDALTATKMGVNTEVIGTVHAGVAIVPVLFSTATGLDINAGGGTNTLTVDESNGTITIPITYNGGTGASSTLVLKGGAFTNEVDTATGAHSGTITLDGSSIAYSNLAPIVDTATAANLTIQGTGAASETINIVNDPNGTENGFASAEVNSDDFEKMDFANKTNVTVDASSTPGTAGPNVFTLDLTAASLGLTALNLVGQGTNAFFIDSPPPAGVAVHIDGGAPGFSLLGGPDANETWFVTGPNQGSIAGVVNSFQNIQYLLGGDGGDAFVFFPGATEGVVNGGFGNNTIVGADDQTNNFYISGGNAGNIVGVLAMFGNVENLAGSNAPGNSGTDVFLFFQSGGLAGQVMGGSGSEWLDYNSQTNSVFVNLAAHNASRVGGGVTHNPNFALNVIGSAMGGDTLVGDATGGVLEGCNTGNTIIAGSGRSILIGGYGRSRLQGNVSDDLIINGVTYFDFNIQALTAFLAEWQSGDSFATRIYDIRVGLGETEGFHLALNSTVFCPPTAPGPHIGRGGGNGQSTLGGGGGQNWFFTLYPNDVADLQPTDVVD